MGCVIVAQDLETRTEHMNFQHFIYQHVLRENSIWQICQKVCIDNQELCTTKSLIVSQSLKNDSNIKSKCKCTVLATK